MAKRKATAAVFPLTLHRGSGQWCKKLKVATTGKWKVFYFGRDKTQALEKYLDTKDTLQAGRVPGCSTTGVTVADVCNAFLGAKRARVESGELSERSWVDYRRTCETIVAVLDRDRIASTLTVADFSTLRSHLASAVSKARDRGGRLPGRRGPVALSNEIGRVRAVFRYGAGTGIIPTLPMGTEFVKPSKRVLRVAKNAAGSKMVEPSDLRRAIAKAKPVFRAMLLLGINGGLGQSDLSSLPLAALDFGTGFIDYPRGKTGVPRRIPLWSETTQALRDAIAVRPEPTDSRDSGLAFITKYGRAWVRFDTGENNDKRTVQDGIGREYAKLMTELGCKGHGSFYNLRHSFRTIADEVNDRTATDWIMGHADDSVAAGYRQRPPSDERLRAVVDAVHEWLFPVIGPARPNC